ncbi:hydroxypyruvate isomerase family protein [Kumtagia ephedrae]|uniref:Isomerase n=1 Tax=Kumtagia ephedrae TaxID=2116701 RepID=A0A2P7SAN4_9HYPH|nr:TIM barrel protein [Mesorhizobium ephedrae]PSJ59546.1 isomerase [Mesorhizobium ephedrae]
MPRFSANLGFLWPDRPLFERIDAAAAVGFRAIELHWPYDIPAEPLRERCENHALTVLGLNTLIDPGKGEFGLGAVEGRQADFQAGFARAAAYARAIGAGSVHVMAGDVAPDRKAAAAELFADNLRWAAGQAPDLTLLLEPLNARDRPGYFYATVGEAAGVIAKVGAPNIKIMFDAYHVGVTEGGVVERLERYLPLVGHVQIAAVPSRAEPDEGEVDYAAFFRALDRLGYGGWVGCEYRPRAGTDEGLGWPSTLGVAL